MAYLTYSNWYLCFFVFYVRAFFFFLNFFARCISEENQKHSWKNFDVLYCRLHVLCRIELFFFSFPFWWVLLFFSLLFLRHLLSFLVLMNCIAGYNWCNENTASGTCFMSIFVFRTSLAYLVLLEPLLYTHGCFLFVSHMFF